MGSLRAAQSSAPAIHANVPASSCAWLGPRIRSARGPDYESSPRELCRLVLRSPYNGLALKVLQAEICPLFSPVENQRVRCAEVPCVKLSGTT